MLCRVPSGALCLGTHDLNSYSGTKKNVSKFLIALSYLPFMHCIESEVICLGKGVEFLLDHSPPFSIPFSALRGCPAWISSKAPLFSGFLQKLRGRERGHGVREFISLFPSYEVTIGCCVPQQKGTALV